MVVEKIGQVGGGQTMERFVNSQEEFEIDAVADGEPMEWSQDWGDMIAFFSAGEESGGWVLNQLQAA